MDEERFDRWTVALRHGVPRRGLGAIAVTALAAAGCASTAETKKKKKKKKKKKPTPSGCTPNCSGKTCGGDGCGGSCGSCNGADGLECRNGQCASYQLVTEWGSRGSGNGEFRVARGIGVDSSGHVYVADTFNNRVQKFTNDGTYVGQWGSEGDEPGQFGGPNGVAVDSADAVYVVDVDNFRVQKFTADGIPAGAWGEPPEPDVPAEVGQFVSPTCIAAAQSGIIYVTDSGQILRDARVKAFASNGSPLLQFGTTGGGEGQLSSPRGVALDRTGNIYVADRGNWRIQKFRSDGDFLTAWGSRGSDPGQFRELEGGVAIDDDDHLYVADEVNRNVQKFDANGNLVNIILDSRFVVPHSVAVDRDGAVFVTDGDRVLKFALRD